MPKTCDLSFETVLTLLNELTVMTTDRRKRKREWVLESRATHYLMYAGHLTKVDIEQDFYLGKFELTQEEWEAVTGLTPSHFSRTGAGAEAVKMISDEDLKRFPVEQVSWVDCQLFIEELNKKEKDTGRVYRLPMEAEWEYACRGGSWNMPAERLVLRSADRGQCRSSRRERNVGLRVAMISSGIPGSPEASQK